ncbi:MAG TPA: hypothetical protein VES91_08880 [Burkholderiaceae bacterium]|nr:hypothetical protein [Burkholderiaceae bacterium]
MCSSSSRQWLDSLTETDHVYPPNARFKELFNGVTWVAEVRRVFAHIATQVEVPSFGVTHAVC